MNGSATPASGVLGIEILGLADPAVPDLIFIGMPGCGLRSTLEALNAYRPAGATHAHSLPIPLDPVLVGMNIFSTAAM